MAINKKGEELLKMPGLEKVHFSQLVSLGATKEQLFFIVILICVVVCYQLLKPIIFWLVSLGTTKMLSYLLSSLIVLLGLLFVTISMPDADRSYFLTIALKSLAVFGGILFFVRVFHTLFYKKKRSNA